MSESVSRLTSYPLTGARGVNLEAALIGPSGLRDDRAYVVYDPETYQRLSNKPDQVPDLLRIRPRINGISEVLNLYAEDGITPAGQIDLAGSGMAMSISEIIEVEEFGDLTPCNDMGDYIADELSSFLNRSVRLARKTDAWLGGSPSYGPVEERANAPLHIVNKASADELAARLGIEGDISDRFRPNIVVDGAEAFEELNWQEITINGLRLIIHRPTLRCPVPGMDPLTGKNLKDVPKGYPTLEKELAPNGRLKPVFGVYAYPLLHPFQHSLVNTGHVVEINRG